MKGENKFMKNILTAVLTATYTLMNIALFEEWYLNVPYYLTEMQSYMVMAVLVLVASMFSSLALDFASKLDKKREEEVKVNWLTVDED